MKIIILIFLIFRLEINFQIGTTEQLYWQPTG